MRVLGTIVLIIGLSGFLAAPALADNRVALVLGNSSYRQADHLNNPVNDATILANILKKAKFDVVDLRTDLTATEMRRALREFSDKARQSAIAVIYYAGHGIEIDGTNYVIPVDATLERDTDVYDEALPLDRLMVAVEPAKKLRLIIVDACRDNPFAKTMKRASATRAIGRGLARVEPTTPNTMIAFAARAGFTTVDIAGKNSPFALALTNHLTTPGLDLRRAFGFVRDDVLKATNNRQEPFIYGSLGGDDVPLVAVPPDPNAAVRRDYELAAQVDTKDAWDTFIATYPDGFYNKLANAQRNKLLAEEARAAAAQKARLAAEEAARRAAERAKASEQAAKAGADTKSAERARITAEKNKEIEETKASEADRLEAIANGKGRGRRQAGSGESAGRGRGKGAGDEGCRGCPACR